MAIQPPEPPGTQADLVHDGIPLTPAEAQAILERRWAYARAQQEVRRAHIRRSLYARELYAGNPQPLWDEQNGVFQMPQGANFGLVVDTNIADDADRLFTVPFFNAYFMMECQLLLASKPTVKFWPGSADARIDVEAAKQADSVIRYNGLNKDVLNEYYQKIFYLWMDGTYASYTRGTVNGQRFGFRNEPIYGQGEAKLGEDTYHCDQCGYDVPASQNTLGACPDCGAPLREESLQQAPTIPTQPRIGTMRTPNAEVTKEIFGSLDVVLPYGARAQWQFPFIFLDQEIDRALIRATYPEVVKRNPGLMSGAGWGQQTGTGVEAMERRARERSRAMMDSQYYNRPTESTTLTFRRAWFRSWAFDGITDDKVAASLKEKFPDGGYFCWAEDTLCAAYPENMDDHWVVCHGLPGEGQIRIPIGGPMMRMQEIIDELINLQVDVAEFTLPVMLGNQDTIDSDAFNRGRVRGGVMIPVLPKQGQSVGDQISSTKAGEWPASADELLNRLGGSDAQLVLGLPPAAFGGDLGGNNTLGGIQVERDQAMGRTGLHWQRLKTAASAEALLEVKEFARIKEDPVSFAVPAQGDKAEDLQIDPAVLRAGEFRTYAEVDEDFPVTWAQKKNLHLQMLQGPYQGVMLAPENIEKVKAIMGTDLCFSGEKTWNKTMADIETMLQAQPVPTPGQIDPMTGQPGPPQLHSTMPPDPAVDDLQTRLAAIRYWWSTPAAQQAQAQAPQGVQNVILLAQEILALLQPPAPPPGAQAPPEGQGAPPSQQTAPGQQPEGMVQ